MKLEGALTGILLAAGRSTRFGSDKLLHPLPDGTPMALASARALSAAVPRTLAVIGEDSRELAALFAAHGIGTVVASEAASGMGASLAAGIAAAAQADGWLVALGDMPYVRPQTVDRVVGALRAGARLAAPSYLGQRGHPVGFSAWFRRELLALHGDHGARALLQRHAAELVQVECDDPGVLIDIDEPGALTAPADRGNARQ
jgi:molybdenum cofactor cytidylyltransferase